MLSLRPYQQEAIDAVHTHVCTKQTNPCVVLPTGSGKSVTMAGLIHKWQQDAPWIRGCVLAHRKELVEQNATKFRLVSSSCVGIFSAGLGRKDYDSTILFASIDSIYKRSGEFPPFDFLFIDEAHRIPPAGEGKYRTFIAGCQRFNPNLRAVGWTATPFRMACGNICHKDHILNEVCYEANITTLINQGYLCRLRSKVGECQPRLNEVKRNHGGDYTLMSLAAAVGDSGLVESACSESTRLINQENRRHCIFFCVDIEHASRVSAALQRLGIFAPVITGKTRPDDRDRIIRDFRSGYLRAICNVNVLTEGFDAPNIDCVVLLRPTLSPGLFSQMVGRGLRLCDGKQDCLVLDFAGCIDEHGPIDLLGSNQFTQLATCGQCRESFSRAVRKCPQCGWEIPKQEVERLEQKERERRMHSDKASKKSILSTDPVTVKVDSVHVSRHVKDGSPDSLRVQYRCGLSVYREWVCLDAEGYAGDQAQRWWSKRFGKQQKRVTVADALGNMLASQTILDYTKTISVVKKGKWWQIIGYNEEISDDS